MIVSAAWGDWAEGVPAGMVLVGFRGWAGECKRIIPAGDYRPGELRFLSDYPLALVPVLETRHDHGT